MRLRVAALLVAILALVSAPAFAQVTGGVKVGVNFSKATFEDEDGEFKLGQKSGLVIGAVVDVPIAPMFSFSPEFLYAMKGGKGGDATDDVKLKIDMFQIPLLFKASFAGGSVSPYIVFGPALGFVTSAKFEDEFGEEDIKDEVEKVEFSGIVGAGLKFGRGTIEGRYDHGFRDLDKLADSKAKTKTFSVLVGVSFGG